MKNKLYIVLPIALLSLTSLVGCGKKKDDKPSHDTETSAETEEQNIFTVTFKNYDELVLYSVEVEKGNTAVYKGETPTKPATVMSEFVFSGWDHDLKNVTESFTTYAQYNEVTRKYTITFKNYDGEVLQNTKEEYGSMPVYNGKTPKKPSDAVAVYTFAGWDHEITYVKEDAVYTAVYNASYAPSYRTTGLVYQVQGYNEYYSVIAYFGNETNVAIPQIFDGLPVKGIRAGAFSNHDKIETIFIPKTIENIEAHAFDNCPAITHLTVGEGNNVYHIDDNGDLASEDTLVYTLPSHRGSFEVKDQYTTVLSGAFSCSGINTLNLSADSFDTLPELFAVDAEHMPQVLKSIIVKGGNINDEQFMDCKFIESISLLHTNNYSPVNRVGHRAFKNCIALKSLTFSDDINFIGDEAFRGCTSMTRLTIGNSANVDLDYVGIDAFMDLPNVQLYGDSGLRTLGNSNCNDIVGVEVSSKSISEVYVSDSIVALNAGVFKGCTNLRNIELNGNKLRYIGKEAFMNCSKLETLHFHMDEGYLDNLDYIPYDAFVGCSKLYELNDGKVVKDSDSGRDFYILKGSTSAMQIGEDIRGIDIKAFSNRGSSYSVTLDENNKTFSIDNNILRDKYENVLCGFFNETETDVYCGGEIVYSNAFSYQHLNSLVIDEGVKILSSGAFSNALTLETKVVLPLSLTTIEGSCFNCFNSSKGESNTLYFYTRENLTTIGSYAFYGSRSIVFYTPFEEKQPGWSESFNALEKSYYDFNIIFSYNV